VDSFLAAEPKTEREPTQTPGMAGSNFDIDLFDYYLFGRKAMVYVSKPLG
jgi:hypothetical protein